MVRAHDLGPDDAVGQAGQQTLGHQEVVQTPANVLGPAVHHVGPESVAVGFLRIEVPAAIDIQTNIWDKVVFLARA